MKHNPSNLSNPAPPIEPWLLTAYALSELDTDDALKVEHALASNPAMKNEFEQIQRTLTSVRSALAKTTANVKLNENQTAQVVSQIKQVDAQNAAAATSTVILAERPFYRRKRFAALLATAVAIPLVATWLYSLRNEMNIAAGTGNKGNIAQRSIANATHNMKNRPSQKDALGDEPFDSGDSYGAVTMADSYGKKGAMSRDSSGKDQFGTSEEMGNSLGFAESSMEWSMSDGGYPGEAGGSGMGVTGDDSQSGNVASGGMAGSGEQSGYGGGGYGGGPGHGSDGGLGRASGYDRASLLNDDSTPIELPRLSTGTYLADSLALHDKRLSDRVLPEELRQNAPHLFNEAKRNELGTDRFERIVETPFVETQKAPLSTFSIDVDTASYCKVRQTLMEGNRLPSPSMVRIEEMLNYFEYAYAGPQDDRPFAAHMIVDRCPWNPEHQLVRVGLQAKKLDSQKRVNANIVFLLDVSGSMDEPNKLPLVKKSLAMLVNQLNENDRVAIVVYAGAAGCVLPSICGAEKQAILSSLDHLNAGGSTNGGQGIQLAYSIAKQHFIPGGANRVILCTDGDFNVGVTGDDALVALMQENAKSNIFLTCLGFGAGNYNDTMMEKISNKGNGVYGMIDNELEGRRMMVEQLGGTLVTVAKDVKIQVDFNPAKVAGYRLIGYEDRRLANKDFDNDQKDAGEIGAGHRVTALYEVIPAGKWVGVNPPSEGEASKYLQKPRTEPNFETPTTGAYSSEVLTLKVRYKEPEGSVSTKQEFVLKDADREDRPLVDRDMRWATSVAEFGLLLRRSEMAPQANWTEMLERAASSAGGDAYRLECLAMMRKARSMFP